MTPHANSNQSIETEFQTRLHQRSAPSRTSPRALHRRSHQHNPRLKQWAQTLIEYLTGASSLSIRQKTQKDGTLRWIVYEAASDTRHIFDTEQAVRRWIEQRHR